MKLSFLRISLVLVIVSCSFGLVAQEDEPQTIRIKKESNLAKAVFDNTEMRLMAIDRFGNPKENKIVSYKLWIKSRSNAYAMEGYANSLNADMIQALRKQTKATKIFFTEITAQEDDGHLIKLPDVVEVWFPDCANCESGKSKRR